MAKLIIQGLKMHVDKDFGFEGTPSPDEERAKAGMVTEARFGGIVFLPPKGEKDFEVSITGSEIIYKPE